MSTCIPRDELPDLITALERPTLAAVDHVARCEQCRAEISSLEKVQELLAHEDELPEGFVNRVMSGIPAGAHPRTSGRRFTTLVAAVPFVLVLGAAVSLVLLSGSVWNPPGAGDPMPLHHLIVAIVATAGLALWEFGMRDARSETEGGGRR